MSLPVGEVNTRIKFSLIKDLSKREIEVVELLLQGLSNHEIGDRLGIHFKTVKYFLTNIYKKFDVKSRTQLVLKILTENAA